MKMMQWIAFIFITGIILVRGLWSNFFILDKFSIGLLFLLAIPLLAPYLKKAKWFGAEFIFKDEIKKLNAVVQKSEKEALEAEKKEKTQRSLLETFSIQNSLQLLNTDPTLSLAALRIEIERVLSKSVTILFNTTEKEKKIGNKFYIITLLKNGRISKDQGKALMSIVEICNKAVHGVQVSKEEAKEIIMLTERLNKNFSVGYSVNFERNRGYREQGLLCEWEHCGEHFPLREKSKLSCPVFGHDCPGGLEAKNQCDKKIDDFPQKRFIKKI